MTKKERLLFQIKAALFKLIYGISGSGAPLLLFMEVFLEVDLRAVLRVFLVDFFLFGADLRVAFLRTTFFFAITYSL